MIIFKKLFKSNLIYILFILFSCSNSKTEGAINVIKKTVKIDKHELINGIYYQIDSSDSVRFLLNKHVSKNFKLKLNDKRLLLDSILVYDGAEFNFVESFEKENELHIIQLKSGFGRINHIWFDFNGKCELISSNKETYFFDACVNLEDNKFYTIISGYGSDPGAFEVFQFDLNDLNEKSVSFKLNESTTDRFERWEKIFKNSINVPH